MPGEPKYSVFLSHAHVDAAVVEDIGTWLEDEAKLKVWLDKWVLVPGERWQQQLAKGIDQAEACAICIGTQTPRGWFQEEIEKALSRQTKDDAFRVIPVILPGGDRRLVDDFLALRTWVDFSAGLGDGLARHLLVSGVKGVPPGRYVPAPVLASSAPTMIRQSLIQIKELRQAQLLDEEVVLEYQRRLLDELIRQGGHGGVQ